jgi:hypothetical protein
MSLARLFTLITSWHATAVTWTRLEFNTQFLETSSLSGAHVIC